MFGKFLGAVVVLLLIVAAFWGGVAYLTGIAWDNKTEISRAIGEGTREIIDGVTDGYNKEDKVNEADEADKVEKK